MHTYSGLVYEQFLPDVERKLERMAKKATMYDIYFDYQISPFTEKVKVFVYEKGKHIESADFWTDGVQVTVRYDIIQANGWTPIAKIEAIPNVERRLITTFANDIRPKDEWFNNDMHCDHCKKDRMRNTVIVCRHIDGREVQVGKGCLKDYTGIDPASIITKAEIGDWFVSEYDGYSPFDFSASHIYFDAEKVIGLACDIVNEFGYVKSTEPNSTKDRVIDAIYKRAEPSDESKAKAELIRDWLLVKEIRDEESFEYNCLTLVESGYTDIKHVGFLAYLPLAYDRAMEREQRRRVEAEKESLTSQHVGEVGKRIELHPVSAKIVTSWATQFGITLIWKILDGNGNVFTWKTSNSIYSTPYYDEANQREVEGGLPITIKGTVKAHTEYHGVCQTELTRCKCFFN